jgi:hypothetical protein
MAMRSSGSRSLPAASSRSTKPRAGTEAVGGPPRRSSTYRGTSREAAAAEYHADARVMARMGFVPESETWSTELRQVLEVRYVHRPERTPAVLEALDRPGMELDDEPVTPDARGRSARPTLPRLPLEIRLLVGALAGIIAGIAICLVLALVSGEAADAISLVGFGIIGLLLGAVFAITRE